MRFCGPQLSEQSSEWVFCGPCDRMSGRPDGRGRHASARTEEIAPGGEHARGRAGDRGAPAARGLHSAACTVPWVLLYHHSNQSPARYGAGVPHGGTPSAATRETNAVIHRLCLVLLALVALAQTTAAQTWPERPIRIIVPISVGSVTDVAARLMAQELQQRLGQTVVVLNKPGAAMVLGGSECAKIGAGRLHLVPGQPRHHVVQSADDPGPPL